VAKRIEIAQDETERILGPEDELRGEGSYAGFFVSVGTGSDVRLTETRRDEKTGARDGITIAAGTAFFVDKEPGASLHMFAVSGSVTVEVEGFASAFGDLER